MGYIPMTPSGGKPEVWVPHPHLECSRVGAGGDWAHGSLSSLPHTPRNQWWGCRRRKWAPLLLTLPATLKCGEGEPPPLFQREAQRGQIASPKLCRTARTRTQNAGLPKGRAVVVVLQCPCWAEGVRLSREAEERITDSLPQGNTINSPSHPCPQTPPHHLSGYLIPWSVHCSLDKGYVPLLTKGPYYAPNWTRAEVEGSASETVFGRGRGHGITSSSLPPSPQAIPRATPGNLHYYYF